MCTLALDALTTNSDVYLLPGITPQSIETCSALLQNNHEQCHVFFYIQGGFHHHNAHRLLTGLGLGASLRRLSAYLMCT